MVLVPKKTAFRIKRGDTFELSMTVQDTNTEEAALLAATFENANTLYEQAIAAIPQVPEDVEEATAALIAAGDAYLAQVTVDITEWEIEAKLSWNGLPILDFAMQILSAVNGEFIISLTPEQTETLKIRKYTGDILFTKPEKISSESFEVYVEMGDTNG